MTDESTPSKLEGFSAALRALRLEFVAAEDDNNAVITPIESWGGAYFSLIGGGGTTDDQNRLAEMIVQAVNHAAAVERPGREDVTSIPLTNTEVVELVADLRREYHVYAKREGTTRIGPRACALQAADTLTRLSGEIERMRTKLAVCETKRADLADAIARSSLPKEGQE